MAENVVDTVRLLRRITRGKVSVVVVFSIDSAVFLKENRILEHAQREVIIVFWSVSLKAQILRGAVLLVPNWSPFQIGFRGIEKPSFMVH